METINGRSSSEVGSVLNLEKFISFVLKRDGTRENYSEEKIIRLLQRHTTGLENIIDCQLVLRELYRTLFEGVSTIDVEKGLVLAAAAFIEQDPAYGIFASRLLRQRLMREVVQRSWINSAEYAHLYRQAFIDGIYKGIAVETLNPHMADYNLPLLSQHLVLDRDDLLDYMGMHTLYERYLLKDSKHRYEMPQAFWMRIAMGLALNESDKDSKAIEFYEIMSMLRYIPSTPTLFHSGFLRAQLSSCYLNTVLDDLGNIFKTLGDNAQLSKWAGGLGTDWTNIRGAGAYIKGIKATSQGVIPYLKIANDVVLAITRSGIRRGGSCAYLEVWHFDIEDFFDLRRNTGDERRRTHDMNTAAWVPDLFMKRVINDEEWTLFSPHEVPDLHDLYGKAFDKRYEEYEALVGTDKITQYKKVSAKQIWRKLLTRIFETGHPWITFKDACNIRSPQDHCGVVHSSNLCTEITLNTSETETAVCNLGSINLGLHIDEQGSLDRELLKKTIHTAVRMLDNVIDLNFYPIKEASYSNLKHRPLGLGIMGFQDALFKMNIAFSSSRALDYADSLMEEVSYYAIQASSLLAAERGTYSTYKGSKWDRGIFPFDTLDLLEADRGIPVEISRTKRKDWDSLKKQVAKHGMRNSNVMAIAPTATISTIAGCYPCIEPIFKNMYVKSNVSGEFTVINSYLVNDLKKLGLWNAEIRDQIKYYDGDIEQLSIPQWIKEKYKTAFELDPQWLVQITALRGKWIDQSQSYNVFIKNATGKKLHDIYFYAWKCGLKTTYYCRTLGATQIEKSTLDTKYGFTQKREYRELGERVACDLINPECESCQ